MFKMQEIFFLHSNTNHQKVVTSWKNDFMFTIVTLSIISKMLTDLAVYMLFVYLPPVKLLISPVSKCNKSNYLQTIETILKRKILQKQA